MEAVALPGRAMQTPGEYPDTFTELATSRNHKEGLLQPMPTGLRARGTLPPSGAARQLPTGLF